MILVDNILGLFLNIKTYKKNASGLFDYCSKEIKEINTFIENTTFLTRKDNQYLRLDKQSDLESRKGEELLFYIRKNKSEEVFTFENPVPTKNITFNLDNISNLNNKMYYVLNSNNPNISCQNDDYYLCQDDIIRMGNVKLIVKEVHIKNEKELDQTEIGNSTRYDINSLNKNTGPIFNFCPQIKKYILLSEDSENKKIKCNFCNKHECINENPLINFCSCNSYFHFLCLKERINKKTMIKQNSNEIINSYYIKGEVSCKKCNLNYPLKFQIEGIEQLYEFLSIDNPKEDNYLILESIENKLYYGSMRFIFVIKLNEKVIKIGRGTENDVVICDPSISNKHAEIKYEKGKIFLKNISRKYGTSILVKKPIKLNDNTITLQIGRSVIQAKQMKYGEFQKLELNNKHYPLSKKD